MDCQYRPSFCCLEPLAHAHVCFYRVTAFGIVRFCVLAEQYWEPPPTRFMDTWGPSYAAFETNLAITTACLPALRPLFRQWFPNTFGTSNIEESRASEGRSQYTGVGSGNERSIRMQDFSHKRGSARCGSNSTTGSQAPMVESAGIRRTTDVSRWPRSRFWTGCSLTIDPRLILCYESSEFRRY